MVMFLLFRKIEPLCIAVLPATIAIVRPDYHRFGTTQFSDISTKKMGTRMSKMRSSEDKDVEEML